MKTNEKKQMSELKWNLFMTKIRILSFILGVKIRIRRAIHCKRGYHRLSPASWEKHSEGKVEKVDYLECKNCDWMFFVNKSDKELYTKLQEEHEKSMNKALKSMFDRLHKEIEEKISKEKTIKKKTKIEAEK